MIPELLGGGAERVAGELGNYCIKNGHNVYYFLADNKIKSAYQIQGQIIYTEISMDDMRPQSMLKWAYIMRGYKKKYKIQVSVSFMEEFNYINILSRRDDLVITRICTIISQRKDLQKSYLYNKGIIHLLYNRADKVVVMTNYALREMVKEYGIRRKRMVRIPNAVAKLEQEDNGMAWEYGNQTVICVGRLENVKQHNVAIRAFSTVAEKNPEAKLLLLGTGPAEGRLKALVRKLGLEDKVIFTGFQKNVGYYLQYAKVFLMTSKTEGFPNSMIEAMSFGIPVVSIDSPGAPGEILKAEGLVRGIQYAKYGILTSYIKHDVLSQRPIMPEEQEIGKAVLRLLEDHILWNKYSAASRKRAGMYGTKRVMGIWMKLMNSKKNREEWS